MISFVLTILRLLKAIVHMMKRKIFWSILMTVCFILLSGTLFYHQIEQWSVLDSLYFAFTTLVPTSLDTGLILTNSFSKIFTMFYLIAGMGAMLSLLLLFGSAVLEFEREELQDEREELQEKETKK